MASKPPKPPCKTCGSTGQVWWDKKRQIWVRSYICLSCQYQRYKDRKLARQRKNTPRARKYKETLDRNKRQTQAPPALELFKRRIQGR